MSEHPEVTFFVDDEALVVHTHSLTLREVLDAAGLGHNDRVLLERRNGGERVYSDLDEAVPLHPGARFLAQRRVFHIIVNGRPREVDHVVLTYEDVVALAPNMPPPSDMVELLVTYRNAAEHAKGDLLPGESVRIRNHTEFSVAPGNRS